MLQPLALLVLLQGQSSGLCMYIRPMYCIQMYRWFWQAAAVRTSAAQCNCYSPEASGHCLYT